MNKNSALQRYSLVFFFLIDFSVSLPQNLNFLSYSFSVQICSSFSPPDDQTSVVGKILASCLFQKCLIPAAPATAFSIKINFLTRGKAMISYACNISFHIRNRN